MSGEPFIGGSGEDFIEALKAKLEAVVGLPVGHETFSPEEFEKALGEVLNLLADHLASTVPPGMAEELVAAMPPGMVEHLLKSIEEHKSKGLDAPQLEALRRAAERAGPDRMRWPEIGAEGSRFPPPF